MFINQVRVKEEKKCVVIYTSIKGKGKQQSETTRVHVLLIMVFPPLRVNAKLLTVRYFAP